MITWDDERNAQIYEAYARAYPLYQETGKRLVALANLHPDMTIVDLACGTGIVTEQIKAVIGNKGEIIGIDLSEAMLALARKKLPSVRFLHSSAEQIDTVLPASLVDVIVCNAAFWQMRVKEVLRALYTILKPGGSLVFNLGTATYLLGPTTTQSLTALIQQIAQEEYELPITRAPQRRREKSLLYSTIEEIHTLVEAASLTVLRHETAEIEYTQEGIRDFLKIPVITSRYVPGSEYEIGKAIIEKAYQQLAKPFRAIGIWHYYLVEKRLAHI
jgi:ubiquinone/menaquinone biosynthesis C-methylase UbiE